MFTRLDRLDADFEPPSASELDSGSLRTFEKLATVDLDEVGSAEEPAEGRKTQKPSEIGQFWR